MKRDRIGWHISYGTRDSWGLVFWLARNPGRTHTPARAVKGGSHRLLDQAGWGWSQIGQRRASDRRRRARAWTAHRRFRQRQTTRG